MQRAAYDQHADRGQYDDAPVYDAIACGQPIGHQDPHDAAECPQPAEDLENVITGRAKRRDSGDDKETQNEVVHAHEIVGPNDFFEISSNNSPDPEDDDDCVIEPYDHSGDYPLESDGEEDGDE